MPQAPTPVLQAPIVDHLGRLVAVPQAPTAGPYSRAANPRAANPRAASPPAAVEQAPAGARYPRLVARGRGFRRHAEAAVHSAL